MNKKCVVLQKPINSTALILRVARSFPCLDGILGDWNPQQFDADVFASMMGRWSSVERMAGLFVLCVWNPGYAEDQGWKFDLFDFVGAADSSNKAALQAWMDNPIWP
jgi:hypothetical protein